MESSLRKWLSSEELKNKLDALNSDLWIGPNATGDGDLLQWFRLVCELVMSQESTLETESKMDLIKEEISNQWGGRRVRISKRAKIRNTRGMVEAELQKQTPIELIPEIVGVSRATLYRMLRKKK